MIDPRERPRTRAQGGPGPLATRKLMAAGPGSSRVGALTVSKDLTPIIRGWDHDPDDLQVRIVPGDDGRDKIQMRIELGLLQLEMDGRPDGQRPHGADSLLDYHEAQARNAEEYELDHDQCAELMREGTQYYHRYLALFHLQRFDLVARDTQRSLRLFRFVVRHAQRERDRREFDKYRPYVTMMHARALGQQALDRGDHRAALGQVDQAITDIQAFLVEYGEDDQAGKCPELLSLRLWRQEIEKSRTIGPLDRLEEQLALAVAREQYEEAARLRDQILRLRRPAESAPAAIPRDAP